MRYILLLLSLSTVAFAQDGELSGAGVFGDYHNLTVTNATGSAKAGFRPAAGFSVALGDQLYGRVSGEFRYTLMLNKLNVNGNGKDATRDGHANLFHYDILVFARPKTARIRPFLAVGAGIRLFSGTGIETAVQPLNNFVALTHTYEVKPLLSGGGGVSFAMAKHFRLRFDFRDYISPVPKKVLFPAPGARLTGLYHTFTGFAGISYIF